MSKSTREPSALAELRRRRGVILRQLVQVEAQLAALEAEARRCRDAFAPPRRGRPIVEQTLADALAAVLRGSPMRIKDAAAAVLRLGYRSGSQNFRQRVANALGDRTRFERVGRGRYLAR